MELKKKMDIEKRRLVHDETLDELDKQRKIKAIREHNEKLLQGESESKV